MSTTPVETDDIDPDPDGVPSAPRPRRRLLRALLATGITLVVLAAVVTGTGMYLLHRWNTALPTAVLLDPNARVTAPAPDQHAPVNGALNYLLIGSDYRSWSPDAGERSDTIIIAHVDRAHGHLYLVSIPRDLFVTIPADPALKFYGDTTKINAAFDYGQGGARGTQLLSRTLTSLIGIKFNGAAIIEFNGLKRAVDVIGGVNVCVDIRTVSIHTGKVFPVGCRTMNSTDALDYLRQREYPDGDFTRQRHQQQFLKSFFSKALSMGVVANPLKLDALLNALRGALTIDTGGVSISDLVFALRNLRPDGMTGIKIPTYFDMINNMSVVVATDDAKPLFAALRSDTLGAWVANKAHKQWLNPI